MSPRWGASARGAGARGDARSSAGEPGGLPQPAAAGGPGAAAGGDPDPDALLVALRRAGGEPPLPPLRIPEPAASARRGPAGRLVSSARRAVVRLLTPELAGLLAQLERDRHRQRAEIARLERRVADLERERGG
ncbi:hypothetical protein [Miltoncostaea marina]|uniref:hypothetical protein n=1 Tax=Miltoncostaea marina TaxID=2843215 RepID=UPI001C3D1C7D|nr:hypothetical protein [Miltoncostaea marina]